MKVKKFFFILKTILNKLSLIFKQVSHEAPGNVVWSLVVNLLRENTRAECEGLLSELLLIQDLLVHQDDNLHSAKVFFLLFTICNALRMDGVSHFAELGMDVVARY